MLDWQGGLDIVSAGIGTGMVLYMVVDFFAQLFWSVYAIVRET